MSINENQKGITLIALVITVIVLLILAGVAMSLITGQNGLFARANHAGYEYDKASQIEAGTVAGLHEMLEMYGDFPEFPGEQQTPPPTTTSYSIGQEVIVGNEHFYVIEESASTQSTVTVMAKYNLNQAGTAQAKDATDESTQADFSEDRYWEETWQTAWADYGEANYEETGEGLILNLNEISGYQEGDAMYIVQSYVPTKGGTNGRLLTFEEADALKTGYADIIWGKANRQGDDSSDYHLRYWLGSAGWFAEYVSYYVDGDSEELRDIDDLGGHYGGGIRPVMTVSKTLITAIVD